MSGTAISGASGGRLPRKPGTSNSRSNLSKLSNRQRLLHKCLVYAGEVAESEGFIETAAKVAATVTTPVLKQTVTRWRETQEVLKLAPTPQKQMLIQALTGGQNCTGERALMLELETQHRAFLRDRELLRGAFSEFEVMERFGIDKEQMSARLDSRTLLGAQVDGKWKFPHWQFDMLSPDGILAGLPEVLRALDASQMNGEGSSDMAKISWLTSPNRYLEGRTPVQALNEGDIERVVDQAWGVGLR